MADPPPYPGTSMTHEAQAGRSPAGRPGRQRLLPIAGITVAVVAVLAHLGGGAVLAYLGLGGSLANLGASALVVGLAAAVGVKLLLVFGVFGGAFGARRWVRYR